MAKYSLLDSGLNSVLFADKSSVGFLISDGFIGFIHNCVIENYLNHHETPEDIELYFCGPPLMNQAVQKMGEDFGIPDEHIRFDDFGG